MPEPLKMSDKIAQPTLQVGKLDILAAREGLAMVMDALRVMEAAGVSLSKASILSDGRICMLPMIEIPGHKIGISVMDDGKYVFTTDGVSVMAVMDGGHGQGETP